MIKKASIENFKSIKSLSFEARRVNIFIGEPNTGKSNILEALGLYSAEYVANLNDIIRFKNINNIFYQNNSAFPARIITDNKELVVSSNFDSAYQSIPVKFNLFEKVGNTNNRYVDYVFDSISGAIVSKGDVGLARDKFSFIKYYSFKAIDKFVSKGSPFLFPPFGVNLFEVLSANAELRDIISGIVEQKGYELRLDSGSQEVFFEQNDEFYLYPYRILSDTLQRIIFYLSAILSNKKSSIIFEEPESHIFPFYNQYLAETIGLDEESENQYFIATHNPYFLGSIAQKTKIGDLAVFITYMENHETKVRALREEEYPELFDYDIFYNLDRFIEQ